MSTLKIWLSLAGLVMGSILIAGTGMTTSASPAGAQDTMSAPIAPPEDPMNANDFGVWTYIPEFSDWFNRVKMKEPGPTGAYAVNFQVWQVEELDRCVFNVFLDNQVPIEYPEDSFGAVPFTYPASWSFLRLTPADQQAVETAYLSKYRTQRATLSHGGGDEPLTLFQARKIYFQRTAVLTLTIPCDRAAQLRNPLTLHLHTTTDKAHEVRLPDHFLGWIQWNMNKWHRPGAKTTEEGLTDQNEWSYTEAFARRFGLPPLNEPPPTGVEAIAFRVERYEGDNHRCLLDLYLHDSVPVLLPEDEAGFTAARPYFLSARGKAEVEQSKPVKRGGASYTMRSGSSESDLFVNMELRTERERRTFPMKRRLEGDKFRITAYAPLKINQYRKHMVPGLSYLSLSVICSLPALDKGPSGIGLLRQDESVFDIYFVMPFLEKARHQLKQRVELPFKRQFPKMFPNVAQ